MKLPFGFFIVKLRVAVKLNFGLCYLWQDVLPTSGCTAEATMKAEDDGWLTSE